MSHLARSLLFALVNLLSTSFGFVLLATVLAVLLLATKGCRAG